MTCEILSEFDILRFGIWEIGKTEEKEITNWILEFAEWKILCEVEIKLDFGIWRKILSEGSI